MKKLINKTVIISLALVISSLFSDAQTDYSSLKEEFRKEIQKKMKKKNIQGVSIALFKGDSIIWAEGFGYSDVENNIKASKETEYRIGSATKLFTGTAIMQLSEKNLLNINDPINKIYPQFSIKSRFGPIEEITFRNVMTHTSGLPCDIMKGIFSQSPEPFQNEIEYLNKEYTVYKPNEVFAYSNPGFNLLGCVIEHVSNVSYCDYIQNNIFDPLEMNNSYFNEQSTSTVSEAYDRKGKLVNDIPVRAIPAGAIKSNVVDMSKFLSSFMNREKTLINEESFNEMTKVQFDKLYDGSLQKIGLVWFIEEYNGYDPIYQHAGGTLFHRAIAKMCPKQEMGIVILTNSYYGNSICSLSSKILKNAIDIKNDKTEKEKKNEKVIFNKQNISHADLIKWNGNYAAPGVVYEVIAEKNRLTTNIQGAKIDLLYAGNNEFLPVAKLFRFLPVKMKTVRFVFENNENECLIYQKDLERNRISIIGQQFEKNTIIDKWKSRVGKYKIVNNNEGDFNLFDDFEILIDNGVLFIKTTVNLDNTQVIKMGLGILSDDLAIVLGKGRQGGYSLAVEYDNEGNELIRFTGYLIKKE